MAAITGNCPDRLRGRPVANRAAQAPTLDFFHHVLLSVNHVFRRLFGRRSCRFGATVLNYSLSIAATVDRHREAAHRQLVNYSRIGWSATIALMRAGVLRERYSLVATT